MALKRVCDSCQALSDSVAKMPPGWYQLKLDREATPGDTQDGQVVEAVKLELCEVCGYLLHGRVSDILAEVMKAAGR